MRHNARHLTLPLGLLALGACTDVGQSPAGSKAERPVAGKEHLPQVMSPCVKSIMSRHAEASNALTLSVALGDHEDTLRRVSELLAEPRFAPPDPAHLDNLNQQLPAAWFEAHESFRAALGRLGDAARGNDDEQTILQFTAVLRSCRSCHRLLK